MMLRVSYAWLARGSVGVRSFCLPCRPDTAATTTTTAVLNTTRWTTSSSSSSAPPPPPSLADAIRSCREALREAAAGEAHQQQQQQPSPSSPSRGDLEYQLTLLLSQSPLPQERYEALERGERLWRGMVQDEQEHASFLQPDATRMNRRMRLSHQLTRCATQLKEMRAAKQWAQRRQMRFVNSSSGGDGAAGDGAATDGSQPPQGRQGPSSMKRYRESLWMEHPQLRWGKLKGTPAPGPRYTG